MEKIDDIDAQILHLLQVDGRAKRTDIAEAVGLSIPSVSDRMRKLTERGVLVGTHAALDAKRLGYDVAAFVFIQSTGSEHYAAFVEGVTAMGEVQELHSVTGDGSHVLKVRVRNTTALERLLARIQALPGVRGTRTSLVLSTHKESTYLPAEPMALVPTRDE
ncbi:Lrp/AsnC family transcriptional regulator [Rubrivirga sp. S365]|uniref:Lrp/AsnC family transcriptional regulator n=1 Tax=Rubrivirga litoralis TaxID=3075598 RepID=A0ABU3BQU8_9BACT|nr:MULTISPECIES: Lrp/AsnC family transcriptional regulator [unclassified Rubrivirga]MDT0631664.1 Lrp/AsnC family transcriptional regulator [Rubrivirga sp. F394]MDT7855593.1 Lrp/AsnC family transcriptional regulator [Rubrivirga sp. S365]